MSAPMVRFMKNKAVSAGCGRMLKVGVFPLDISKDIIIYTSGLGWAHLNSNSQ